MIHTAPPEFLKRSFSLNRKNKESRVKFHRSFKQICQKFSASIRQFPRLEAHANLIFVDDWKIANRLKNRILCSSHRRSLEYSTVIDFKEKFWSFMTWFVCQKSFFAKVNGIECFQFEFIQWEDFEGWSWFLQHLQYRLTGQNLHALGSSFQMASWSIVGFNEYSDLKLSGYQIHLFHTN